MYANARLATSDPQTCLQSSGAAFALHVNTAYMTVSFESRRAWFRTPKCGPDFPLILVFLLFCLFWTTAKRDARTRIQPLLILFFRFFAKSYLSAVSKSSKSTKSKSKSKSKPSSSENPSSSVSEKTSTSSSTATATAASSAAQRAATLAVSGEDAARLVVGEKEGDGVLNGSGNGNGNGNGIGIGRASANGKVSIVNGNGNGNGSAGERKKER